MRGLADRLGSRVVWIAGGEEEVLGALEFRRIALVVGGLTDDSPWSGRVAFTRPYVSTATVVAGREGGLLEQLDGLEVAVPRGSPAGALVEDADGIPVVAEEGAPAPALATRAAHELRPDEHVKITLDTAQHVVAVPPGENRWLVEVDRFFAGHTLDVRERLDAR